VSDLPGEGAVRTADYYPAVTYYNLINFQVFLVFQVFLLVFLLVFQASEFIIVYGLMSLETLDLTLVATVSCTVVATAALPLTLSDLW
jgi:hypothetical protein